MTDQTNKGLSANALKLIAAACMLVDHVGAIILPQVLILRFIGRLAFPIYAFMVAQGCRHTRNKLRYFLGIFLLGVGCQLVYTVATGADRWNILLTFSASILILYCILWMEGSIQKRKYGQLAVAAGCFVLTLTAARYVNRQLPFDYGMWGCMAAVLAGLFPGGKNKPLPVLLLGIALLGTAYAFGSIQLYALLALPLLLCYSGARGKRKMKHFFYIFYPAHLALLYGVAMLIK